MNVHRQDAREVRIVSFDKSAFMMRPKLCRHVEHEVQ